MKCKKCGEEKLIVNKHFGLCMECNQLRLKKNKPEKTIYKKVKKEKKRISHNVDKRTKVDKKTLDEAFYYECFKKYGTKCEECGKQLPENFRDEKGRVSARYRYSHIIAKSIAPELRHNVDNINILCLECHSRWEHGDKKDMKIWSKNKKRFPNYLS